MRFKRLVENQAFKVKLKNIGVGYSAGSDISFDPVSGQFLLEISVYGTKPEDKISFRGPQTLQDLIKAYATALKNQDPIANDIKQSIDNYKKQVSDLINGKIIQLLNDFDTKVGNEISQSITNFNRNYTQ